MQTGIAGMPTAFVASYGTGKPVIAMLAEYDALPGMSQKVVARRASRSWPMLPATPAVTPGLGTGALGAVLAVKAAMEKHGLKGTIRLYGTPAEETLIGKVYMTLDGVVRRRRRLPALASGDKNDAWSSSSKALVSAKFTFQGTAAHASVSPHSGRSALDAVELMNVGGQLHARAPEGGCPRALRDHRRRRCAERRAGQGHGLVLRAGQRAQGRGGQSSAGCRTSPRGRP